MDDVKSTIYAKLKEITEITAGEDTYDVTVRHERPEEIVDADLNLVIYSVADQVPTYDLGKSIGYENVIVKIDLWSRDSIQSNLLLVEVEEKMRELNYLLTFSGDISDPKGYSHIVARFNF